MSAVREDAASRTRAAILDAAEDLFAESGYAQSKLTEIAARAGVALNTVYTSVGGKKELVHALVGRYVDHPVIQEALAELAGARSVEELLRTLVSGIRHSYEITLRPGLIVIEAARDDSALRPAYDAMTLPFLTRLRGLARVCAELHPRERRPDPEAVFEVFWFFVGYRAWETLAGFGWSWDDREQWTVDRLAEAIAALPPAERS